MSGSERVFATIAFQFRGRRRRSVAGFFCLWDDQLTFVRSAWVRFVVPAVGLVPNGVRPDGVGDRRTCTRIPYADITEVAGAKRRRVVVRTRDGVDYFFGGGQLNNEFTFAEVSKEIRAALTSAGHQVAADNKSLAVGERATAVLASRPGPVSLVKARLAGPSPAQRPLDPLELDDGAPGRHRADGLEANGSVFKAVAFGMSAALLGAALIATVVIFTGENAALLYCAVGIFVPMAVAFARPMIRAVWFRAINVSLTLIALLLAEYVTGRHFGGLADAPLLLSPHDTAQLIQQDVAANPWVLLFAAFALLYAWIAVGFPDLEPAESSLAPKDTPIGRRFLQWATGRGASPTAAASAVIGLASLTLLASVGPKLTGQDHTAADNDVVMARVKSGDCFNEPAGSQVTALPEVACDHSHDGEVFYIFAMPPGDYPGDDYVDASAEEDCGTQFDRIGYPVDVLDFSYFTPRRASWESGDRSIRCILIGASNHKLDERYPIK